MKHKLEQYTAQLFYAFQSVKLDEASQEAGLWQGRFVHDKLWMINEIREMLGFDRLESILDEPSDLRARGQSVGSGAGAEGGADSASCREASEDLRSRPHRGYLQGQVVGV